MNPSQTYAHRTEPAKGRHYGLNRPDEYCPHILDGDPPGGPHPIALVDLGGLLTRVKWSGRERHAGKPLPKLGDRVRITFNGLGTGTVVAYFVEAGFLGVKVRLDQRPAWHVKQNGHNNPDALVFGAEIEIL